MIPWISCFTFTRTFFSSPAGALIVKVAISGEIPDMRPYLLAASSYVLRTLKSPFRRRVTRRRMGKESPRSNMTTELVGAPSAPSTSTPVSAAPSSHEIFTGSGLNSIISYGNTLNRGERMADCRAAPRATASSAFIVVDRVEILRISMNFCLTNPIREVPPTISTDAKSLAEILASARHAFTGASNLSIKGLHMASYSGALSMMWKSKSSMRHSRLIDASFTPFGLSVFFAFSAAANSLSMTFGLSRGLPDNLLLNFSTNLAASQFAISSSKFLPPKS
mmetsp:Transcript_94190/g.141136  ORF Transcript_94190/g.141136 Transcript_94190/m.141136 type:complete len:279 (-) Transcript_94190:842-1678(-)